MPGPNHGDSIVAATVTMSGGKPVVFPKSLSKSFSETRNFLCLQNEYHDGSIQVKALVTEGRRTWQMSKRLTPTVIQALLAFWKLYPHHPFYFYDPFEVDAGLEFGSNWDADGAPNTGRHLVVFQSDWQETLTLGRSDCQVTLVEVA